MAIMVPLSSYSLDDPQRRQPDISRAQKYLNWSPTVNLEEGLAQTISYFRQYLAETNQVPALV